MKNKRLIIILSFFLSTSAYAGDTIMVYFKTYHWINKTETFVFFYNQKKIHRETYQKGNDYLDSMQIIIDKVNETLPLTVGRVKKIGGWTDEQALPIYYEPKMKYLLLIRDSIHLKRKYSIIYRWTNTRPRQGYDM